MSAAAAKGGWLPWRPFEKRVTVSAAVLEEILIVGQAFRWKRIENRDRIWQGVWGKCVARVRLGADGGIEWSCPLELEKVVAGAIDEYFATETDFAALAQQMPWRTDAILKARMDALPGLRILRQPVGETLLVFLCSSAKQLPHIAAVCEAMAARLGEKIWNDVRALPTWERLARTSETELRACSLGFRARYIAETARRLTKERLDWQAWLRSAPYAETHPWLTTLPGVGPKIADCVLLYGGANMQAFPVDTWILKAMERRYALHGWQPAQMAHFGRAHFGPLAGLAQQFLFSGERREKSG